MTLRMSMIIIIVGILVLYGAGLLGYAIAAPSVVISPVAFVADGVDGFEELAGPKGITVATIGSSTYALVSAYDDNGVQIIDITDPFNPSPTAAMADGEDGFEWLASARHITTAAIGPSTYAFVSSSDNGVQIIDITTPSSPTPAASISSALGTSFGSPRDLVIFAIGPSTYALVAGNTVGIQIINITDPFNPSLAAAMTDWEDGVDGVRGLDTTVIGSSTYGLVAEYGGNAFKIINITDPSHPSPVATVHDSQDVKLDGATAVTAVTIGSSTYALVAAQHDDAIQIINITDPSNPSPVAFAQDGIGGFDRLEYPEAVTAVTIGSFTYAFVAAFLDGIQIIDITDPSNPTPATSVANFDPRFGDFSLHEDIAVTTINSKIYIVTASYFGNGVPIINVAFVSGPLLTSASLDEGTGILSVEFTSAVDVTPVSMVDLSGLVIHDSGQSITLTGATLNTVADSAVISIEMNEDQRRSVAAMTSPLLDISGAAVTDTSGDLIESTSDNTITVTDDAVTLNDSVLSPFITTWQTTTAGESITIPVGSVLDTYTVSWGDGNTSVDITGDQTHMYDDAGTYTVSISGDFTRIALSGDSTNAQKMQSIEQWGDIRWNSMSRAFYGASNMIYNATDAPNLSGVTDMSGMFRGAFSFNGDISDWNVSSVTYMGRMFFDATSFNQRLDSWNVSSVIDMHDMFAGATSFNGDISDWNVSSVTKMNGMFAGATSFNGDISDWNVSSVTDMYDMFWFASSFNQPLNLWNVSSVTNMHDMFAGTPFNQPLNLWNVSSVTDMNGMFGGATSFNGDISDWDVSSVTDMRYMLSSATFNQPLDSWNVSSVADMNGMFGGATTFNQPLDSWDISSVTDMNGMFGGATSFNGDISGWNVSSVTDMSYMFQESSFNGDISEWNVSSVADMNGMFGGATTFNQPLDSWDISSVTDMNGMFGGATSFNGNIFGWNVSSVTDMSYMFHGSSFNGDISEWDVSSVTDMNGMFGGATTFNQPLDSWDISSVTDMNGMFGGATSFNGDISGWNVSSVTDMSYMFQESSFNGDISEWDVSSVTDMSYMFGGATTFNQPLDSWDISSVTDMNGMFGGATSFNGDISGWNVSSVTDMSYMFQESSFNGDISEWDVSSVTDMSYMFGGATTFNQPLDSWDISSVTDMNGMFGGATSFNGDISGWNVSSVTDTSYMFQESSFNGDISEWDVSSVTDMSYMFRSASFNGDISEWNVSSVTDMSYMFLDSPFNGNLGNWYIALDNAPVTGILQTVGNITTQNEFLATQGPTYGIGSSSDSEHFGINGTALVLTTIPDANPAIVNITSTGDFGTSNSRIFEITFSSGVVDTTNPRLESIERYSPASQNTNSQSLIYEVTFSESVTGVTSSNFILFPDSTGGGTTTTSTEQFTQTRSTNLAIPDLQTVSDTITVSDSGTATSVSVAVDITHTYIGDLKIDLIAPDGTTKILHNRSDGSDDDIVKTYTPNFDGVSIAGVWTLRINDNYNADPGTLNSWTLTINHGSTTTTVNPVTGVSGSGDTYYVTVSSSTDGTYNLDLVSSGHDIADSASNPLTNTVPTGADETYIVSTTAIDTTNPRLESIERYSPASQNTNSQSLIYEVTFSESVTGVTSSDFILSPDSTGGGTTTTSAEQFTQARSPNLAIPDLQTVSDTITVSDSGTATSVSVAVDITHTYIGDLKIDLIAPDGTTKILHNRSDGSDDDIVKTYTPNFDGVSIAGVWTLQINDNYNADPGVLNSWTLTINHGSTATTVNPVTGVSGSGDTYYVTVSSSTDGTYNLDLVSSGHDIADAASNSLANTSTTGADETYTVSTAVIDNTNPRLESIERYNPSSATTDSQTLIYEVTFSEDVTGVTSSDFVLSSGSPGGTGGVTSASGSGDTYYVTVSSTISGTYNLDLVSSGHDIADAASNSLANTVSTGADETYIVSTTAIDTTNPRLESIERYSPASQNTNSQSLIYEVTFSESVTGVTSSDFILFPDSTGGGTAATSTEQFTQARSPNLAIPDLQTVSDTITVSDSGTATSVSVAVDITHTYIGDLKIDLIAPDGTTKILHNRSDGSDDDIVKTYTPNFDGVSIAGVWTLQINDNYNADPGVLNSWTLTINHGSTATTVNPVTGVSGSGDTYYVTVSSSTDGTYNLDLVSSGHDIADAASNSLANTSTTGADETYTVSTAVIDNTNPRLESIERYNPSSATTDSQTLIYEVTFSEDVTGVTSSDFVLSSGSPGGTGGVTSASGSGDTYYVTVSSTISGTYNLDLVSSGHDIADAASNSLANTVSTGADETYIVSTTAIDTTNPRLESIERYSPASQNTNSQSLIYEVTFSESVTGVTSSDFILFPDSTGGGTAATSTEQFTQARSPNLAIPDLQTVSDTITVSDSGTATSVSVAVDITHTYIGDLKIDLIAPDGTIRTLHNRSGGSADDIDQTYAPSFGSIPISGVWTLRINDNYNADPGVLNSWTLTINHGSTATTVNPVTGVSGSGDTYYVTVSSSTDGTYNLDLVSSGHDIADAASNSLANTSTTGADETYTVSTAVIDDTAPTLESIQRYTPATANTDSQTLVYKATFSEDVTGVTVSDFVLSSDSAGGESTSTSTGQFTQTRSPNLDIPDLATVSDTITVLDSETATSVSVEVDITHTYIGDLKIDIIAPDGTSITLHDNSGGSANDIDKSYDPLFGSIPISGVWTLQIHDNYSADPGVLNSWTLTINYGDTATTISSVTDISGSGDAYYVTVSATQDGTYNLDLLSSGHDIADATSNPLTNAVPTEADETYTVTAN